MRIFLDSEFGASFVHISGSKNTVADGLSRPEMADDETPRNDTTQDIFALVPNNLDREENTDFPLDMKCIMFAQQRNEEGHNHRWPCLGTKRRSTADCRLVPCQPPACRDNQDN